MFKYFTKAFKITNDNIILTTPLVLFLLLFGVYTELAQNAPANLPSALLLLTTMVFMLGAFMAGWFYMVKKGLTLTNKSLFSMKTRAKLRLIY